MGKSGGGGAGSGWDARYDRDDYLFGTEPAAFVTDHAGFFRPGARVLAVADGEGRNSVWAARQGCEVTAMEASPVALAKARRLADGAGVAVTFRQADILEWDWSVRYDIVLAVFIQFVGPAPRARIFEGLARAVAPGGVLMLHGYTPAQLAHGTGGPRAEENLYTPALLREAFAGLHVLRLAEYEKVLQEGVGHAGRSALIDLIAQRD
ncbi:MAG: class I SAM-dependent methyltransferase [Rhodobacteraceae bacterium]|nr:class I SAM-dependent methyltransferase [Paracoccaceae bacterium]